MITNLETTTLIARDYTLGSAHLGWLTPTDPEAPIDELREQYQAQGYLWLRHILPREAVLAFRRRYFEAFRTTGLLAPDTDPVDGIAAPDATITGEVRKLEIQAVKWAAYEAFCLLPEIIDFYERFLGGTVYLHRRKLIRRTLPGSTASTPAHYDLTYLRGGTDQSLCTSWIPLGDTPVEMGGLIYLEGSDAAGRKIEADLVAKNADLPPEERLSAYNRNMEEGGWISKDLPALAQTINTRWLIAHYEAGDMMVHSPYMIHAATANLDPQGRMRLSTDIRYQLVTEPIDKRWTNDWHPEDNL